MCACSEDGYARNLSPVDYRSNTIKRLIGLPGDWISVTEKEEIRKILESHCWVDGDNGSASWDSRSYGPDLLVVTRGRQQPRPRYEKMNISLTC